MSRTFRACVLGGMLALLVGDGQLTLANALADNQQPPQELHNITYRARVDGLARGALILYKTGDTQVQSANPTMLPGRLFEVNAVLEDPQQAGMQVSIQWPYSANLHCEILVDDATTAQADEFIAPRALPVQDDPNYGVMSCGAPIDNASANAITTAPTTPRPSQPAPAT